MIIYMTGKSKLLYNDKNLFLVTLNHQMRYMS